jgi:hypothetical protein
MERIFDVGGKRFVTSLEWIPLTGKDVSLAAKIKAKGAGARFGVLRTIEIEDGPTVSQVGISHQKLKGVFYSAAAHLANNHHSFISIEKLEDNLYWLCVAQQGRVLPGYDTIANSSEVKALFTELSQEISLDYMKFLMESSVAMELDLDGFGLSNLINQSPLAALGDDVAGESAKVKNLIGVPSAVYLGGILLVVVALMGGIWKYQEIQKQKEMDALLAQDQADLSKIESQVTVEKVIAKGPTDEELLRRARQEEITWLRDDFNRVNTLPALKQFYFLNKQLPRYKSGWQLATVRFDADTNNQMSALWLRQPYGTPQLLRQAFGGDVSMSFTPEMGKARTGHKISLGSRGIDDILGYIRNQGIGHQAFVTDLINNKLQFISSVSQETNRKQPIDGLKNTAMSNMAQLIMKTRHFEISGDDMDRFTVLMDVMQRAQNFLPDSIELNRSQSVVKWKLTGTLYEE